MTTTTRTYHIGLDAAYDLRVAAMPTDDLSVQAYIDAYRAAAMEIAAERGISIEIIETTYDSAHEWDTCPPLDDEGRKLWQDIHTAAADATYRIEVYHEGRWQDAPGDAVGLTLEDAAAAVADGILTADGSPADVDDVRIVLDED